MRLVDALVQADQAWQRESHTLSTRVGYARNIRRLARTVPLFDGERLLSPEQIITNLKRWRQRTTVAIRTDRYSLISFFDAIKWKDPNPARLIDGAPLPPRLPRPIYDPDILERLWAACETAEEKAYFLLGLHMLRRIEICRLSYRDLQDSGSLILRVHGKGDRLRDMPLKPRAATWLLCLIAEREGFGRSEDLSELKQWLAPALHIHPATPVFQYKGERLPQREAGRLWETIRERANVDPVYNGAPLGIHRIRHTAGMYLVDRDVNLRKIQEFMGHASISTTEHYTAVSQSAKESAIAELPLPGGF